MSPTSTAEVVGSFAGQQDPGTGRIGWGGDLLDRWCPDRLVEIDELHEQIEVGIGVRRERGGGKAETGIDVTD